MEQWRALDEAYSVGELRLKLFGWQTERRFVVVRKVVREGRDSVGRKLIDVPGYVFRIFVTTHTEAPEEVWRDYNLRSDMENRIAELKHDLEPTDSASNSSSPPKQRFGPFCCCSTYSPSFSALPTYLVIANRPPFAPKFSPAAPSWVAPEDAWFFTCRKAGVACKPETLCSATSSLGNFQLRRSWIPSSPLEPDSANNYHEFNL